MQVIVRSDHFQRAFLARLCEWMLACALVLVGIVLILPAHTLPSFAAVRTYIPDATLGPLLMVGGTLRLVVLSFNGLWAPPMYLLRAWMALSSMFVWLTLTMGSASSGLIGIWLASFPLFAAFDCINFFRAIHDATEAKRALLRLRRPDTAGA